MSIEEREAVNERRRATDKRMTADAKEAANKRRRATDRQRRLRNQVRQRQEHESGYISCTLYDDITVFTIFLVIIRRSRGSK